MRSLLMGMAVGLALVLAGLPARGQPLAELPPPEGSAGTGAPVRSADAAPPGGAAGPAPPGMAGARPDAGPGVPATLLADRIDFDQEAGLLIASGDVRVYYGDAVLSARQITYDQARGTIRAEGPLVLTDGTGTVLLADRAALSPDLTEGLIAGARLLLQDRLQLAALEARRSAEGRLTTLERVVASACAVCPDSPTPLWAVRAARVTQDAAARRVFFENARFEVLGLPVLYLPRLSVPEPGVTRASGFLLPAFRSSDLYGYGVRVPYFQTFGPSADLTVAPVVTTRRVFLLEGEFRQRVPGGGFDLSGVLALADGTPDGVGRGVLEIEGGFRLPGGWRTDLDIAVVSDPRFLRQFDYSDADRLTSRVGLARSSPLDEFGLGVVAFQSLRSAEDPGDIPQVLPEIGYRRIWPLGEAGIVGAFAEGRVLTRSRGREQMVARAGLDWQGVRTIGPGIRAGWTLAADGDVTHVQGDPDGPDRTQARGFATAAIRLDWPLIRRSGSVTHVIEPGIAIAHTGQTGRDLPPEDSLLPEFDTTNLFALNRFPGGDLRETGLRGSIGLGYRRIDPGGWTLGVRIGRVLRDRADPRMPPATGLDGTLSAWVAAGDLVIGDRLSLLAASAFDDQFDFLSNEFALALALPRGQMTARLIRLAADPDNPLVGPLPAQSAVSLTADVRVARNWALAGALRYDLGEERPVNAEARVIWGNDCAELDLSVSRRFTSGDDAPPATAIGFNVRLAGFGETGGRDWPPGGCRRN